MPHSLHDDIASILIPEAEIQSRVKELGRQITADYQGKDLFCVSLLKGSILFLVDLTRQIDLPLQYGFITISTYKGGTHSQKAPSVKELEFPKVEGKDVLIVEDILDSGRTVRYAAELVQARNPRSLKTCFLLAKGDYTQCNFPHPDYIGFKLDPLFVVGYGLDYQEKYRNLPYIGQLKPEVCQGDE